jgi:hypothetical protein
MFANILNLFRANTTVIPNIQEKRDIGVKKLVSRYSNGNISLQQSNYITKKQLAEKQEKVFMHKFV